MMSTANMLTANNHVMANKMSKRNISKLKSQTKGIASRLHLVRPGRRVNRWTNNRGLYDSDSVSTLSSPLNFYLPNFDFVFHVLIYPFPSFPLDFTIDFWSVNVGNITWYFQNIGKSIFYPHWNRAILLIQASYWLIKKSSCASHPKMIAHIRLQWSELFLPAS